MKCKAMATLKLAIPKSCSPIFLLNQYMVSTIGAVAFFLIAVSEFKKQLQQ